MDKDRRLLGIEIDFRHTGKLPIVTSGEKACGEWKEKPGGVGDNQDALSKAPLG